MGRKYMTAAKKPDKATRRASRTLTIEEPKQTSQETVLLVRLARRTITKALVRSVRKSTNSSSRP